MKIDMRYQCGFVQKIDERRLCVERIRMWIDSNPNSYSFFDRFTQNKAHEVKREMNSNTY